MTTLTPTLTNQENTMPGTFEMPAEYLPWVVGRRVGIRLPAAGGTGMIPGVLNAVRHHPESGTIRVDASTPAGLITGIALAPGTLVNVEHQR